MKNFNIGRFLSTFANQTDDWSPGHKGANNIAPQMMEYELTSALGSGETLTLQLPLPLRETVEGVTWMPGMVMVWSLAEPSLPGVQPHAVNTLILTSHDRDTGVTVLTAGSAGVADDAVVMIAYYPSTLGVA